MELEILLQSKLVRCDTFGVDGHVYIAQNTCVSM